MHTEDEAKTKWCPKAVVLESYAEKASFNVTIRQEQENIGRCIGSACMAWRWSSEPERRDIYQGTPEFKAIKRTEEFEIEGGWWRYEFSSADRNGKFDRVYRIDNRASPTHGYCGAFGKPGDE